MIISISGKPGSGKSTVAKRLAEELGYKYYYVGGMRRKAAQEKGMTLAEFNKLGEKESYTDRDFDEWQAELGTRENNFVIEGRTSFYFIPRSLKICLDVSYEEGARRIWNGLQREQKEVRNEDRNLSSHEDVLKSIKERVKSGTIRYAKYYDIKDVFDKKHFDFYLDTTKLSPEEEYQKVYRFVKKKLAEQ